MIKVLNRSSSVARQCPFNTYSTLRLNSIHCCRHNYIFFFILQVLENLGYRSVILQIGRGVYEPEIIKRNNFSLTHYRYKDSIAADIQRASLVISHAGKKKQKHRMMFKLKFISNVIHSYMSQKIKKRT